MDPKELLGLKKDHTSNLSENQEPSVKIIPIIKKTNKVNKRVTFDPDSTLLPSYTKVPLNESSIETISELGPDGKVIHRQSSLTEINDGRLPALGKQKLPKASSLKNRTQTFSDDSEEFLPNLVKNSISMKQENSLTININSIVKCNDFFPIDTLFKYLEKSSSQKKNFLMVSFDGVESTTDLVFYLLYKYFKKSDIWSKLKTVTLDSCRYVTDFGIELLYETVGRTSLIDKRTCAGCTKIYKYFHLNEPKQSRKDLFSFTSFTKTNELDIPNTTVINTCKVYILNDANFEFIKYIETKSFVKNKLIVDYAQYKFEKPANDPATVNEFKYNLFECDWNYSNYFHTPCSLLIICVQNDETIELAQNITNKLLDCFGQGNDFLDILVTVVNDSTKRIEIDQIFDFLKLNLKQTLSNLLKEEDQFFNFNKDRLNQVEFNEQEKMRDKLRIKFNIEKFLNENKLEKNNLLEINESDRSSHDDLITKLKSLSKKRIENIYYTNLKHLVNQKKFKQKIIKLEELIDEAYSNDTPPFKMLIQTNPKYHNLVDDFFQFYYILGECIYGKVNSGQQFAIFDLKWFFKIINNLLKPKNPVKKHAELNSSTRLTCFKNEISKILDVMDALQIADTQQFDFILEILKKYNFIMKIENEKENLIVLPCYFTRVKSHLLDFKSLWSTDSAGCFQATCIYEFYYNLPNSMLTQIMSSFLKLTTINYISNHTLICQEGCFNIFINYDSVKLNLELSIRTANFADLFKHEFSFKDDLSDFKNSMLCLFNEYRIVLECCIFENSIPFSYFTGRIENLNHTEQSFIHSNFKYKLNYITSVANAKLEEFLVTDHEFKSLNQFEVNQTYFKCKICNVNESWSRLVFESYRKMYPMVNSEKNWLLRVNLNEVIADFVKPERKSVASLFNIGSESVTFHGTDQMSPFSFNSFKMTITSLNDAERFKVGISIVKESTMEREIVYINVKTRRLQTYCEKIEYITSKTGEKQIQKIADSDQIISDAFIRSQRYTKEYRNKVIKLPESLKSPMAKITVEEKTKRAMLMEQIANLRTDANSLKKISAPETWQIMGGDTISVNLVAKESNSCELSFYFNNEKIGTYLIDDLESIVIFPYAAVKGGQSRIFFDISSSRFKSILANDYSFHKGMYLEAESKIDPSNRILNEFKKPLNFIAPAIIENINENGLLLVRFLETKLSFWIDALSNLIHPCGYWQYLQKEMTRLNDINFNCIEEFRIEPNLMCFESSKFFSWQEFFKLNESCSPAAFNLFTNDQKSGMSKLFFPDVSSLKNNYLTCSFKYNPRYVWSSLKQLSMNDLTDIYRETRIITVRDDPELKSKVVSSGLVLLPESINEKFIQYPCISYVKHVSILNVTCTHREDIKLNIDTKTSISNSYPHLLKGEGFDLIQKEAQLHFKHLFLIMCTSLDLSNSTNDPLFPNFSEKPIFKTKEFNDSLRYFFRQLWSCVVLIVPLFYTQEFRFSRSDSARKSLIIEKFMDYLDTKTSEPKDKEEEPLGNPIDEYIRERIAEFEISSNGLCKYCNMFNLMSNPITISSSSSLDKLLLQKIATNQEYSKIITSIKLQADEKHEEKPCISLDRDLLDHLPNVGNISIKNICINHIDSQTLNKCFNLRNIEFIQNDLNQFPSDFFKDIENSSLQQIIIDNNPLREIPIELFRVHSLRSLILTRLNITSLPDRWLNDEINTSSGIRSVHIAQTKLKTLPTDLLEGNYSLEQLTFQGVNLIIPETESQWSFLMVDLNRFQSLYCPNLLSLSEAKAIFQRFDTNKNNILDYKELQQLNAYLFKSFPRLGDDTSESVLPADTDESNPSDKKFTQYINIFSSGRSIMLKIFKCVSLTYLDLSFQSIRKISNEIKALKNLKVLKLAYCVYLETLSSSLGLLKLNELDLTGCLSLKTPPPEIQRRGVNSVLAYLNRLITGSVQCKRTKLMIQGLGGVGKTSLMQALLHKIYQNSSESTPNVTDGISICDWTIQINNKETDEKEDLTFSVFDFAGQTVYYNTHQFFLTNRSIYLLVWNVRLGAEHSGLDFWLNSIDCHAPLCPIFIVGTHIDQVNKYDLPMERLKKKYPQIAGFFFVSSFSGVGISELSTAIINAALNEKYMGEKIPKCWLQFENTLKELKKEKNIIEYSEVEKIASNYGIFDQIELTQAIQFLHDLGSLMYFNNEFLSNKLVINPQFMVDLMACLVSVNNNFIRNGKLYHNDISKIWYQYEPSLHAWILKVTEKFDLSFSVPDQSLNLVPCLMSETPEDSGFFWPEISDIATNNMKENQKETKIVYEFDYLPAGLFNRAQCRLFQITNNKVIWKNGSLLVKNSHLALITRQNDHIIEVKVQGVQPENIIFLIHEVIEVLIAESFNGVNYDFSFPCPDCFEQGTIDVIKSMYSASLIRRATKMNAVFLQCRQHFHVVPIIDLHTKMPPDSMENYDLQLRHAVRDLKHLKQELTYDIVLIYSNKDTAQTETILHPRLIKSDLVKADYSCWFTETPDLVSLESIAIVLHSASLVIACISDNFVSDSACAQIFNYVKLTLNKPYVLVALGESFQWQKSEIGALVTDEFFVKINKKERYKTSLPDLLDQVKKKINNLNKKLMKQPAAQIFISYCRTNSHDAIAKGTPLKNKDSLGWSDPRSLATYLTNEGYSCWIDFEQVGGKKTLFEDIVEGIRSAKVMIACISNEYAKSDNCMKEFRFASNLKMPIILCTFGSADCKCEWRSSELGIISCLMKKEINFQLENPNAYQNLLSEIQSFQIAPATKIRKLLPLLNNEQEEDSKKSDATDTKNKMAYTELIELAQRKFIRQIASYTDTVSSRPFPRLFTIDLMNDDSSSSGNEQQNKQKFSQQLSINNNRLCLKSLCESENGWHLTNGQAIEYEILSNIPEAHFAYLMRIMSLIRESDLDLDVLRVPGKLDELIVYLEESLQKMNSSEETSFKESYSSIKNYIQLRLEQKNKSIGLKKEEEKINQNRIENFKLNRCGMPSGKVLWLCDKHSQNEYVQVLTSNENVTNTKYQNEEVNSILFDELKKYDTQKL